MNQQEPPAIPLPLAGLRVLEFSHVVLGPACGLMLADMGADVIRVERAPDGDDTRRLKSFGTGYFPFYNRNKRSVMVDLKAESGLEIVRKLVATADILIENFGPGTMDRIGLGYEALSLINPRLIYSSLKGFMPGPYEHRLALDEAVQMMSGAAYMTGPPGRPLRMGASVIDAMGGLFGAFGILAALRERDASGRGMLVQNGLFETAAFLMGQHMAFSAISGEPVPPMAGRVPPWSIYRPFASQEGDLIFVGVTTDKHWQRFCTAFGRPDWASDPRLHSNNNRVDARDWFIPELERLFAGLPRVEILRRCEQAQLPYTPINRPEDLFTDPHLEANGGLLETFLPNGVQTKLPRLPLMLDGRGYGLYRHPPAAGEHTGEILGELGYTAEAIAAFVRQGTVALAEKTD